MVLGVAAVAALGWVVAPWVAMARHGTLDQQALAAMREPVIPAPRSSTENRVPSVPAPRSRVG